MKIMNIQIVRKKEVIERIGISKATLHRHINNGEFVPPIPLGARSVGFLEHEVDAIIKARVQRKNIKEVVATLLERRENLGAL
jgi:prophage regulatory protein